MAESQPDWAYSFQDETWWSRFSQPDLHSWVENGQYTRLIQQTHTKDDADPKALACYGLLVRWKNDKAHTNFYNGHAQRPIDLQSVCS